MKEFTHQVKISVPIEAVAEFHRDARILRRLTMPPIIVQIHEVEPLDEGSKADFTLWIGPLPVRWLAVHSQVDTVNGFTDTQVRGPFRKWVHRHSFIALDEHTTEIRDEIQAEMATHPFWYFVCWFMWLGLPMMFAYRGWVVRRALEKVT